MLGIIIGIMSIITIVIIGDALTASVSDNLAALGGNNIILSVQERGPETEPGQGPGGGRPMGPGRPGGTAALSGRAPFSDDLISDRMIADMRVYFADGIQGVSLSHSLGSAEVRDGDLYANITVSGVNTDYLFANNTELLTGRFISDADLAENSMTALVSDRLAERMFPDGADPIGQHLRVYKPHIIEIYTIIGVYRYEESGFMGGTASAADRPTAFYIPLTTAMHGLIERNYSQITVIGSQNADVHELADAIQNYFNGVYANNDFWRINVINMASILDTVTGTLDMISLAIAFIAGISLLVGGIGVMNIMLVSVTERTREIGTRKALGAKNFHIRFQFVIESLIVALFGGISGMLLGVAIGGIAAGLFNAPLVISPLVIAASMLFSMAIGVFFGIYPANKAAKLDPIDALRYE